MLLSACVATFALEVLDNFITQRDHVNSSAGSSSKGSRAVLTIVLSPVSSSSSAVLKSTCPAAPVWREECTVRTGSGARTSQADSGSVLLSARKLTGRQSGSEDSTLSYGRALESRSEARRTQPRQTWGNGQAVPVNPQDWSTAPVGFAGDT